MKINFRLPNTKLCLVVTFTCGSRNEHLIPTPPNNDVLRSEMLKRKIGYSEIRAVKAVDAQDLARAMTR